MAKVRHRKGWLPGASLVVAVLAVLIATVAVAFVNAGAAGAVVPANGGVSERDLLGRSIDGRPIYAYRMGSPYAPTKAVVIGNTHGDETAGITVADAIIHGKGIHAVDLWVIPTMNPDGTAAHRHGNARGVDLNRNFPFHWARLSGYHYSGTGGMSEPETRIIMNFLNRIKPRYIVSMHQPLDGVDTTGRWRPRSGISPEAREQSRPAAEAVHLFRRLHRHDDRLVHPLSHGRCHRRRVPGQRRP